MSASDPASGRSREPEIAAARMTDPVEVSWYRSHAEAEQQALVLVAVGIECRLVATHGGVSLCVARFEAEQARQQLACYAQETKPRRSPVARSRPGLHGLDAALAYCAVLVFFFAAEHRDAWSIDWLAVGAAQGGLIRDGAWWRTITSLTLHADLEHLMGNLAFGAGLGLLAAQLLGAGLAWLVIVVSGGLGNAIDAVIHDPGHTAIGASTAIFGALGILAGYYRRSRLVPWRGGLHRWAPLAAGVLLLAFLGSSGERTDVAAHVAGFGVGTLMGLALAHAGGRVPQGPRAQWLYGLAACGLITLAWLLALLGWG